MKPEAKSKVVSRHRTAIGMFVAWLQGFPEAKRPPLSVRVEYFDRCVDSVAPDEIKKLNKRAKKRAKIEHSPST